MTGPAGSTVMLHPHSELMELDRRANEMTPECRGATWGIDIADFDEGLVLNLQLSDKN